jgi:UDP-glucose 4-epimerase
MKNGQLKSTSKLDMHVFKDMNIVITGGAGFIGSHVAEWLLAGGAHVTIADTFLNGSKIEHLRSNRLLDVRNADVRDYEAMSSIFGKSTDFVFHLACVVGVEETQDHPLEVLDVEVMGTRNILRVASENGVKRVVVASSSEVYGDTNRPMVEDGRYSPRSTYAAAKQIAEEYCAAFYRQTGLEYVLLRYFNVYGPRQDERFVVSRFIDKALKGEPLIIYGDGRQTRDFTYIHDSVTMTLLAAINQNAKCQAVNIGTGKSVTINELATEISRIVNNNASKLEYRAYSGNRPVEIEVFNRTADTARSRKIFNYTPAIALSDGLEMCIDWYRTTVPSPVAAKPTVNVSE